MERSMVDWRAQIIHDLVDSIPLNLLLIAIGAVGYLIIGGAYLALQHARTGQALSTISLLRAIFPVKEYRHFSSRVDMLTFVPSVLLFAPLAVFATTVAGLLIGVDVLDVLTEMFGKRAKVELPVWAIVAVQFISYMVGHEFGQYASHYALHRIPFLWAIHRAHHSAEALNFFTNPRAHPLDLLILIGSRVLCASFMIGAACYVTGNSVATGTGSLLFIYNFVILAPYTMLTHSHIPLSFGGRFNILIGGPVMHQIHHSADKRHHDKNIGGAPTYIFDWLFGTLYLPVKGEALRFGLNDKEFGELNPHRTFRDFYLEPLVNAVQTLRNGPDSAASRRGPCAREN
jgi:sterol desaturase/sphingolipid hydroxylase (fatty acid hydroxylase superfamily)